MSVFKMPSFELRELTNYHLSYFMYLWGAFTGDQAILYMAAPRFTPP